MMPSILMDPSILWLIDNTDNLDDASTSIENSIEWMKPNAAGPIKIYLSRIGVSSLTEEGAFPAEPRLTAVLKHLGLDGVINPRTLATSVSRFLASNPWAEDEVELLEVNFRNVCISADLTETILSERLRELSLEGFGLAAICGNRNEHFSMYAFPRQAEDYLSIRVNSNIDAIEFAGGELYLDSNLIQDVSVLRNPADWKSALSYEAIWKGANNSEELELAIFLLASEIEKVSNCGLKSFRVGTEFLNCLRDMGAVGNGPNSSSVLQKCAMSVLKTSSLQPSPFTTSSKANASVRMRDRDKAIAWRLHVTKDHEALRLMYWELPDGEIEFATLEQKWNETIAAGEKLPVRQWDF